MKYPTVNSSVFASKTALAALKKRASFIGLPISKKQALVGTGASKSPFKTKGMDFSEVRQYQAGDDVRQIDWRVTAKYGKPFTKLYTDEKERQVVLVCDMRSSMKFATSGDFKSVLAAKMTAFLGWVSVSKGDTLKTLLVLPDMLKVLPIGKGEKNIAFILDELSEASNPFNVPQDILSFEQILKQLDVLTPKGASVFILSDFHDITPSVMQKIGQISVRADVSFVHIFDAMEEKMPTALLPVTDGQQAFIADMKNKTNRKVFEDSFTKIQSVIADAVNGYKLGYLPVRTDEAYLDLIARYCEGRAI
ncbi:MAG: DUF58 domain-containing protein [Alphaproteobacteria bacterium]|nr:DUF58 domain-containing protein [Alphaproteobacteria bacterium]